MRVLEQLSKDVWQGNRHIVIYRKNIAGELGYTAICRETGKIQHLCLPIDRVSTVLGYTHTKPIRSLLCI